MHDSLLVSGDQTCMVSRGFSWAWMPPVNKLVARIVGWKGVVYIIIPESWEGVSYVSSLAWGYGNIECCAELYDASPVTNLNFALCFFQHRRRTAARTWWVSLRGHVGALLLSASAESSAHVPDSDPCKYFFVDVFFLVLRLMPVLHQHILPFNRRLIPGIEWLSRHLQSHQWSESIKWVLCFGFFFFCCMLWSRTNCTETAACSCLTSESRLLTLIYLLCLLKLWCALKNGLFIFLPLLQTRLVPNWIKCRRHSHGKKRIQGRRVCQFHG